MLHYLTPQHTEEQAHRVWSFGKHLHPSHNTHPQPFFTCLLSGPITCACLSCSHRLLAHRPACPSRWQAPEDGPALPGLNCLWWRECTWFADVQSMSTLHPNQGQIPAPSYKRNLKFQKHKATWPRSHNFHRCTMHQNSNSSKSTLPPVFHYPPPRQSWYSCHKTAGVERGDYQDSPALSAYWGGWTNRYLAPCLQWHFILGFLSLFLTPPVLFETSLCFKNNDKTACRWK